jgi:hypothetical protein
MAPSPTQRDAQTKPLLLSYFVPHCTVEVLNIAQPYSVFKCAKYLTTPFISFVWFNLHKLSQEAGHGQPRFIAEYVEELWSTWGMRFKSMPVLTQVLGCLCPLYSSV